MTLPRSLRSPFFTSTSCPAPQPHAGGLELGPLEREVVPPRAGEQGHERSQREEDRANEPARAAQVEHAGAAAVHQHQGEAAAGLVHECSSAATTDSPVASTVPGRGILQWPSNITPSSSTTIGAWTSPRTRALPESSTRSLA